MNLKRHHRQTVTLKRRTGFNEFQEPTYATPVDIKALYIKRDGLRRSLTGEEVDAESYVQTTAVVSLGDLINDTEIRRIEEIRNRGRLLGVECYL